MGCVSVRESSVRALEKWGKFERFLEPGLHLFNPLLYSVGDPLSMRLQTIDYKVDSITKESLSVLIHVGIQFYIDATDTSEPQPQSLESVVVDDGLHLKRHEKLYKAYYGVAQPVHQIEQHILSYFRAFAAQHTLQELLLAQSTMSDALLRMLNQEMLPFGYRIFRCVVTDIDPPKEIKQSMNTVLSSQNKQQAMINEAEGKKRAAILEAEGLCQVKKLEGEGMSLQRQALADGLHTTMNKFGHGPQDMDSQSLTSVVLTMQYLDMLTHAAQNGSNSFILSSNPLGAVSIDEQLKTSMLATRSSRQSTDTV